jgi:hypothetical protein
MTRKNNSVEEIAGELFGFDDKFISWERRQEKNWLRSRLSTFLESIAVEVEADKLEYSHDRNDGLETAAEIIRSKITKV